MDKLPMTQLDILVSGRDLQILKHFLPLIPSSHRKIIAVYLKFIELQNTLNLFSSPSSDKLFDSAGDSSHDSPLGILSDILPFLSREDQDTWNMITGMFEMIQGMDLSDIDIFKEFNMGGTSNAGMDESSGNEKH